MTHHSWSLVNALLLLLLGVSTICECWVVYGTVAEREVVVVVDESGVVFLAGRSELVVQRILSLYIGGSPCRWDDAAELH